MEYEASYMRRQKRLDPYEPPGCASCFSQPGFGPMQVRRRGRESALPQPRIRVRGKGPPAGRVRFLVARAPCRARFSPISVHGPAGLGTVSVHDVPGAYTAQRVLGRFPYATRHGGGGRTLYTGDPVRTGVCALVAACTVQTPVGTGLLVRKVPVASSGHRAPPPAVP
jgi:hypothetical protein